MSKETTFIALMAISYMFSGAWVIMTIANLMTDSGILYVVLSLGMGVASFLIAKFYLHLIKEELRKGN